MQTHYKMNGVCFPLLGVEDAAPEKILSGIGNFSILKRSRSGMTLGQGKRSARNIPESAGALDRDGRAGVAQW